MVGSVSVQTTGQGTVSVHVTPSAAATALLNRGQTVKVTLAVTFTPRHGQPATRTVTITLRRTLPSNTFTVRGIKAHPNGTVTFALKLPGAGKITVIERARTFNEVRITTARPASGQFMFSRKHLGTKTRRTMHVTVKPDARGRRLVAHHQHGTPRIKLTVTYQPTGGSPRSKSFNLLLRAR